ncbi:MAG: phosphate/phosphite/phosphonate ABC transporter substrate-binding protein [Desulfosarcinaceae bacterium]
MRRVSVYFLILFSVVTGLHTVAQDAVAQDAAAADYRIGVLAKRGSAKALEQWGPTAEYLTRKLQKSFVIVPLKFTEIEPALKNREIDYLLANSAFYATFQSPYNLRAILTMVNRRGKVARKEFGGVIFTRSDSGINSIDALKGKDFMCVKYSSFGGAHMAWRLLLDKGIDPKRDFKSFKEGGTHDKVVMAVKSGAVAAGTVRSDTLERMQDEGKININDFKIINRVTDTFPFIHSTQLYPEWPLVVCSTVDKKEWRKVAKALMLLPTAHEVLNAAKVYKWTYPSDYAQVTECLKVVGLI